MQNDDIGWILIGLAVILFVYAAGYSQGVDGTMNSIQAHGGAYVNAQGAVILLNVTNGDLFWLENAFAVSVLIATILIAIGLVLLLPGKMK